MMPDHIDELLSATEHSVRNEAVWQAQCFLMNGLLLAIFPHWLAWLCLAVTGISFLLSLYTILVALPRKRRAYWEEHAWEYEYDPGFTIRDNVVEGSDPIFVAGEGYEPGPRFEFHCQRCDKDVDAGRCGCTTSPSPWVPNVRPLATPPLTPQDDAQK